MTDAETKDALGQAIESVQHISQQVQRLAADPRLGMPVTPDTLRHLSDDDAARLHGFLRLFEQLHQLVERRLFRGVLLLSYEDAAKMSVRNMTDRLETLGAIESSDQWREVGRIRNALAHDYPGNFELHAARVNDSHAILAELCSTAGAVIDYIAREHLLAAN